MSDYRNVYVTRGDHTYRVAIHAGLGRPLGVWRRNRLSETALDLYGLTGSAVVEAAKKQLAALSNDTRTREGEGNV